MFYNNLIIRIISNFVIVTGILYSLYIQIQGEVSPGGGFQAGGIIASCLILYDLTQGLKIREQTLMKISISGALIYILTGVFSLIKDSGYLDYNALLNSKLAAQKLGIFLVEIGVLLTVSSTLTLIYLKFSRFEIK